MKKLKLKRALFVLSLDVELGWGRIDHPSLGTFLPEIERTRSVYDRLLQLFDACEIPATWALVGAMVDKRLDPATISNYYSELDEEPLRGIDVQQDRILQDHSLLDKIHRANMKHEIASHSYAHILYGSSPLELVRRDLEAFERFRKAENLDITSFVFPRNDIGKRDVVRRFGFEYYRGKDQLPYGGLPSILKRLIYHLDLLLQWTPATVLPIREEGGLINLPGSMIFRQAKTGINKRIDIGAYVEKAKKGLDRAVERTELLHLWFHPFNFAYREDQHFAALKEVFLRARELKNAGQLEICTMRDVSKFVCDEQLSKDRSPKAVETT